MNYAAVINGPFSSNNSGSNQYPRAGYTPNDYGQQTNVQDQNPRMMQYQTLNSGTGQPVNVYQQFSPTPVSNDPRKNIHIGSKLFVGQVPAMTTEEQLRPVFEPYGELLEVKIMRDPLGRSKGSAWVRYETNEMAMNAINALNEKHTVPPQTNPLRVQFATPNSVRHQQLQQQARYAVELKVPMNQYNFGGSMGGGTQQGGMVMVRPGASPNVVPPISANAGGRYVSAPFGGGSMESPPIMSGPYTSSANRFENVNSPGNRRDLYSPLEQPQPTAPQLYQQQQQQQQRVYSSPIGSPSGVYNQMPSRQPNPRNNSGKSGASMGSFETGHGMSNSNSNGAPNMVNEMSTLDAGIAIWEARSNSALQGQEQREPATRVRSGERKEE
ncbi:RNA-binding protein [Trypanosoma conorhini]|uniref:RNA-binding protein n=1 Tax=Trypanosoma conorhini TaxID=83891 RepID=A0A3R7MEB8_9TRYP|nr:RNA-binding protein [Trypanosoma conorhini]RNF04246.1 RNA-binding protein [Trypanosoma conorhini]